MNDLDLLRKGAPFICGASTKSNSGGMPDHVTICRAPGADYTAIYVRSDLAILKARNEALESAAQVLDDCHPSCGGFCASKIRSLIKQEDGA
jgi:hypothetical protein